MLRVYSTFVCKLAISLLLTGCWLTPEERGAAGEGAAAGAIELVGTVGEALTAWETGGISAAAAAILIGVWKGISKGYQVANRRKASGQG